MKTKSPRFLIFLGTLLISITLMLRQFAHLPDVILGFITGVSIGALIVGIIKIRRGPYNKKNIAK